MTSEAQQKANRTNAESSTGPRTPEGKARAARNSVKRGLFAARDLVLPEEQAEYDELRTDLEAETLPATVMERTLAMEILHATWRLRRCALTEAGLSPDDEETMAKTQATIDRARAHARNNLHRATADLSRLQTERHLRAQLAPEAPEDLASRQAIAKALALDTRRRLNQRKLAGLDSAEAIFNAAAEQMPPFSDLSPLQNEPNPEHADNQPGPDGSVSGGSTAEQAFADFLTFITKQTQSANPADPSPEVVSELPKVPLSPVSTLRQAA